MILKMNESCVGDKTEYYSSFCLILLLSHIYVRELLRFFNVIVPWSERSGCERRHEFRVSLVSARFSWFYCLFRESVQLHVWH
jgi:hypothetical protein